MSTTPTKLGALAANNLREKRGRVGSSCRSPGDQSNDSGGSGGGGGGGGGQHQEEPSMDHGPSSTTDDSMLEVSMADTSVTGSVRSNVYSFFDPQEIRRPASFEIRRPPTSPLSGGGGGSGGGRGAQPFDEPGVGGVGGGGGDDSASRDSHGSAATERIGNHRSASPGPPELPRGGGGGGGGGGDGVGGGTGDSAAAAAAATIRPPSAAWINEEREVNYEEGATELFGLVEDAKWEEVCDRVEEEPTEARVWVISSGTENTVFSWSVWRRLPLHEACRRQPPPVVIYALLSAYPESSMAESNFGELPLHAAVRCGACAEVVNCILASYPAAALARDNSGCTPLDILNGTGKMMDHDAVVAALSRTITVLTREEQSWESKISTMQQEFKQSKEKRRREYERIVANKNAEIEDLKRTLDQEKLATSNLASKVIQTEQVVQDKGKLEKRYIERIKKMDEEIRELRGSNSTRKAKIKDLEDIVRSDRMTIVELNNRVQTLQSSLTSLLEDEEAFVATKLARAEKNFKTLMESQFVFMRETERRKDLLRSRVKQLGIKIPPKKKVNAATEEQKNNAAQKRPVTPQVEEVSNNEVADMALASAMVHLNPYIEGEDDTEDED